MFSASARSPRSTAPRNSASASASECMSAFADRRQAQRRAQRIEQGTVARRVRGVGAQRLAYLCRTRRMHFTPGFVKAQAGLLERQSAKFEQGANLTFRVGDQIFVNVFARMRC